MDEKEIKKEFDIEEDKELVLHNPPSGSSRSVHVEVKGDSTRCTYGSIDSEVTKRVLEDINLEDIPPSTRHRLNEL